MAMDTMPSALDVAFRTALLLTGDTRTAEAAVMHGIGVCEVLSPGDCSRDLRFGDERNRRTVPMKSSASP
jgi:hypothetical protein